MPVYLHLFHGRLDPDQKMNDWGDEGPVLGPLRWVHVTYFQDIEVAPVGDQEAISLALIDDLLYYDGWYYGDWSVLDGSKSVPEAVPIDPAKCAVTPARDQLVAACEACLAREDIADDELGHQFRAALAAARREQTKETT